VVWQGRRAVLRQRRRWSSAWSPEQISQRLKMDFPGDPTMRISHEAIYQALYIQGRGTLRRELSACLRSGRTLRLSSERARNRGKVFIADALLISDRPAEIDDWAVPGHWEGDLILGLGSSAIGTLVERTTRLTMLLQLPRIADGRGAEAVRNAIAGTISNLPVHLRRSLTWDQGAEMPQHAQLRVDSGLEIYFCDPQSPWQRASNENINGLLRQYSTKGTDLSQHGAEELCAVAQALNTRPRKTPGWQTPAEALDRLPKQDMIDSVATTG